MYNTCSNCNMGLISSRMKDSVLLRHMALSTENAEDEIIIAKLQDKPRLQAGRVIRVRKNLTIQQFMNQFTGILLHAAAYGFPYAKPWITATTVRLGDIKVTLLDTPGVGSLMNGQELSEHDIFNLIRTWLLKSSCKRHNTLLTGILYFQNTVTGRGAQLDINCFSKICKSNNLYQSVVLVATGEQLVERTELEIGLWREAMSRGAKPFSYIDTKESAEEAIITPAKHPTAPKLEITVAPLFKDSQAI
ncbi:hypothetical protein BKA82DRAFT_10877 [Pisolithus tinctorius]|nr:hypothetical protein BKA82DRAFT_10877 [Pisolithus tinctorius]